MTRKKFNQANQQTVISSADRRDNLTLSQAHQLFLEVNKKIEMKSNYMIKNLHLPLDMKLGVFKNYCENNLLSSNSRTDILSKKLKRVKKKKI